MSVIDIPREYDYITSKYNGNIRLEKYNFLVEKLSILIPQVKNIPPYYMNTGGALLYIIYIEHKFKSSKYLIADIYSLLEIYCKTSEKFIASVVITVLSNIFIIPSPVKFTGECVYNIHTYLKNNLDKCILYNSHPQDINNPGDEDKLLYENKHETFCELLSTFFMLYSNKIYTYKKSLPENYKQDDVITKLFKASLIGQAVGDALGFLVEGQPRNICETYVSEVIKTHSFSNYGVHKDFGLRGQSRYIRDEYSNEWAFKLGQYTDDTQLCRELIKSISMNKGQFNPTDYTNRLIMLFGKAGLLTPDTAVPPNHNNLSITTGIVGYGKTTLATVQCLADGLPWDQTGVLIKSQGNGGCMRVGPLGVLFFEQPWKLREIASLQTIGTHGSSRCRASAVLVAEAVRLACESSIYPWSTHIVKKPTFFCARLSSQLRSIDMELAKTVKLIPEWLKELDEQKLVHIITQTGAKLGDSLWQYGNVISASAVQTALFAVTCFLKHPDNYEDTICMAIRAGGDVDTTAAIAGAIVAARTGNYLPVDVNDRGKWNLKELNNLAEFAMQNVM